MAVESFPPEKATTPIFLSVMLGLMPPTLKESRAVATARPALATATNTGVTWKVHDFTISAFFALDGVVWVVFDWCV